jgi:hypothetical protein
MEPIQKWDSKPLKRQCLGAQTSLRNRNAPRGGDTAQVNEQLRVSAHLGEGEGDVNIEFKL